MSEFRFDDDVSSVSVGGKDIDVKNGKVVSDDPDVVRSLEIAQEEAEREPVVVDEQEDAYAKDVQQTEPPEQEAPVHAQHVDEHADVDPQDAEEV